MLHIQNASDNGLLLIDAAAWGDLNLSKGISAAVESAARNRDFHWVVTEQGAREVEKLMKPKEGDPRSIATGIGSTTGSGSTSVKPRPERNDENWIIKNKPPPSPVRKGHYHYQQQHHLQELKKDADNNNIDINHVNLNEIDPQKGEIKLIFLLIKILSCLF